MEIYIQKIEKIHITKEQQKEITCKTIKQAFENFLRQNFEYQDANELRIRCQPQLPDELWACKVETDYHHGGEDISWRRIATQYEKTKYSEFFNMIKIIEDL